MFVCLENGYLQHFSMNYQRGEELPTIDITPQRRQNKILNNDKSFLPHYCEFG